VPVTVSDYEMEIRQQLLSTRYGISFCHKEILRVHNVIFNEIIVSSYNSRSTEVYSTETVTMDGNYLEAFGIVVKDESPSCVIKEDGGRVRRSVCGKFCTLCLKSSRIVWDCVGEITKCAGDNNGV